MTETDGRARRHDDGHTSQRDAAWAEVHEPSTSSARLAEIAGRHPEFASAIVAHPRCYPELAAWASSSGLLESSASVSPASLEAGTDAEPSGRLSAKWPSVHPMEPATGTPAAPDQANHALAHDGWVVQEADQSRPMTPVGHATAPSAGAPWLSRRDLKVVLLVGLLGGVVIGVIVHLWYWLVNNPLEALIPDYPEAMGFRALLYTGVLAVMITTHALLVGLVLRRSGVILATLALTLVTFFPIEWLATPLLYPGYEAPGLLDSLGTVLLYVGLGMMLVGIAGEAIWRLSAAWPDSIISRASIGLAVPLGWTLSFVVQAMAGSGWPAGFEPLDWFGWLFGLTVAGFAFSGLIPAAISARWIAVDSGVSPVAPTLAASVPNPVQLAPIGIPPRHDGPPGVDGRFEHPKATQVLMFALLGMFVFAPLAIAAWVAGAKAKAEIAQNPGVYRPSSSLQVGYVLGIVGTLLWTAGIVVVIALLGWLWSLR